MLEIRRMRTEDLCQVYKIEKETFSQPWSLQAFQEMLAREETIYLVACEGDAVLGYIGIWKILDEGNITNVAVRRDKRDCKIGSMLLENACRKAEMAGISALTLEVRIGNKKAIHLYEKYGFEQAGIRPGFYDKPREDAIIMWRNAPPSETSITLPL